jgi:hypothetical protein
VLLLRTLPGRPNHYGQNPLVFLAHPNLRTLYSLYSDTVLFYTCPIYQSQWHEAVIRMSCASPECDLSKAYGISSNDFSPPNKIWHAVHILFTVAFVTQFHRLEPDIQPCSITVPLTLTDRSISEYKAAI